MVKNLTAEYVRSVLDYNPETGIFLWKYRYDVSQSCNTRWAGKKAGCWSEGYLLIRLNDVLFQAHRLAWLIVTGEWPNFEIDHRDLNSSNNKFKNLREATKIQNLCNKRAYKTNTSGYKGVSFYKARKMWRADINVNKKQKHLGVFKNKEDAYSAYCEASKKYHGEFGRVA